MLSFKSGRRLALPKGDGGAYAKNKNSRSGDLFHVGFYSTVVCGISFGRGEGRFENSSRTLRCSGSSSNPSRPCGFCCRIQSNACLLDIFSSCRLLCIPGVFLWLLGKQLWSIWKLLYTARNVFVLPLRTLLDRGELSHSNVRLPQWGFIKLFLCQDSRPRFQFDRIFYGKFCLTLWRTHLVVRHFVINAPR